jgi:hypothetical protein
LKRQHPLFSILSIGLTIALLTLLGITIRMNGFRLFSPGRLSAKSIPDRVMNGYANHAEFEEQCDLCHQPLKTTQDALCLYCHITTRQEIESRSGLHARLSDVRQCATCHPDHRGTRFDPGQAALADFNHAVTDFSLIRHQVNYDLAPIGCAACHMIETRFTTEEEKCTACHANHDLDFMIRHAQEYGMNCSDCHDGLDSLVPFDHAMTEFRLVGKHATLDCAACHGKGSPWALNGEPEARISLVSFKGTPRDCSGCHAEPAAHLGLFSADCADCHTQDSWSPARFEGREFEHFATAGFSLERHRADYAGLAMNCSDCHRNDTYSDFDLGVCTGCHAGQTGGPPDDQKAEFMSQHREQFGEACLDCHDGVDRMSDFDHARFFPLDGRHAEIACQDCHADRVFRGTPSECVACHAEPEIHAGFFGLQCQLCHTTQAWTPAALSQHDFPLDHGGQGEVACETCHAGNVYVEYTCYGCHEHRAEVIEPKHLEKGISLEELAACVSCHPDGTEAEGHD